jgi:hypothetical protein
VGKRSLALGHMHSMASRAAPCTARRALQPWLPATEPGAVTLGGSGSKREAGIHSPNQSSISLLSLASKRGQLVVGMPAFWKALRCEM